jgi:tRNA dimethylallyltransferase
LHARLTAVDPVSAARLHPNDLRRMIRALEVFELTGRTISDWQTQWPPARSAGEEAGSALSGPSAHDLWSGSRCMWLHLPRAVLFERIDRRVVDMMTAGLIEEVRRLREMGRPLGREASQAAGYAEMFDYLGGKVELAEAIRRIQTRTRNLAKRQITWFRHLNCCQPVTGELTFSAWGMTMDGTP